MSITTLKPGDRCTFGQVEYVEGPERGKYTRFQVAFARADKSLTVNELKLERQRLMDELESINHILGELGDDTSEIKGIKKKNDP